MLTNQITLYVENFAAPLAAPFTPIDPTQTDQSDVQS